VFSRSTRKANERDQLNRYWDGIASGHRAEPGNLDPGMVAAIEQLLALDDAPLPRTAFVEYVGRKLELSASVLAQVQTGPLGAVESGHTLTSPTTHGDAPEFSSNVYWADEPTLARRTWDRQPAWLRHTAELAAAGLAVAAFATLLVLVLRDTQSDPSIDQRGAQAPHVTSTTSSQPVVALPSMPDGQIISLDEAIERAREFVGDPTAGFSGELLNAEPRPGTYQLWRDQPSSARDEIWIDADTGEVTRATFHSHTLPHAPRAAITEARARAIATAFAREHFAGFDQLTPREVTLLGAVPTRGDNLFAAHWQLQAPNSEAWLTTQVDVYVDLDTGQVFWYAATRDQYTGPTIPVITRKQAISAVEQAISTDLLVNGVEITRIDLLAAGKDRLLWMLQLQRPGGFAYIASVDAITGEVDVIAGQFGP
jgi:hypothetical protein